MTDPADPYRRPDPMAPPPPPWSDQPPPQPEPETPEPAASGWSRPDAAVSGPPASGPPGYPTTLPVPYPPAPAAYLPAEPYPQQYVVMSGIGYGVDPVTGQPYSAKSKVTAGLLQLLPGLVFGLGGIGRLYAGNTTIGVVQLVATVVGWISFWCGFFLLIPFLIYGAIWLWFVIDGIVMLAGRPVDGQRLPLRP